MPDPESKARDIVRKFGKLSSKQGALPSNVSGRKNLLGTALKMLPKGEASEWPGIAAEYTAKSNMSKKEAGRFDAEMKRLRSGGKKKLKKINKALKEGGFFSNKMETM